MPLFEDTRQMLYAEIRVLREHHQVKNDLRNLCDTYVGLLNLHHALVDVELGYLARPGVQALGQPVEFQVTRILHLSATAEARSVCNYLHGVILQVMESF